MLRKRHVTIKIVSGMTLPLARNTWTTKVDEQGRMLPGVSGRVQPRWNLCFLSWHPELWDDTSCGFKPSIQGNFLPKTWEFNSLGIFTLRLDEKIWPHSCFCRFWWWKHSLVRNSIDQGCFYSPRAKSSDCNRNYLASHSEILLSSSSWKRVLTLPREGLICVFIWYIGEQ